MYLSLPFFGVVLLVVSTQFICYNLRDGVLGFVVFVVVVVVVVSVLRQ